MFNTPRLSVSDGAIGRLDSNPTSVDHSRDQRSPHGIEGAGNGTSTHENQRRRSNHGAAGGRSILTDAGSRSRTMRRIVRRHSCGMRVRRDIKRRKVTYIYTYIYIKLQNFDEKSAYF